MDEKIEQIENVENKKSKIKKESFMQSVAALMISQVVIKLIGLLYKLYLTNKEGFGDAGNAINSGAFSIYALLLTISSIGVPNAVSRLVSERISVEDYKGAHRIFKVALGLFACIGFIGTLLMFFGAHAIANSWLQIPESELTIVNLSPAIFFVSLICVFRGYFNGRSNMKVTANSQTMEQIFKTVFTIVIVEIIAGITTNNTVMMAAGANVATTLSTIGSFIYLFRYYKIRKQEINSEMTKTKNHQYKTAKQIIKMLLAMAIPMTLSAVLTNLNRNIDAVTVVRSLKNFLSPEMATQQYGILSGKVDTLTNLPLSFNIAFATALVPTISAAKAKNDMKTAEKRTSFSLMVTMIIGLPCMVGMIVLAQPILNLLFPNASSGAFILQVSSLAIIFTVLEQTVNGALQGLGKVMIPTIALAFGVLTKLILNLVLVPIPSIGAAGAAFATAACHAIAFTIGFRVLRKHMNLNIKFTNFLIKPVIACGAMALVSYATYIILSGIIAEKLATIIAIVIAMVVYALFIVILKIFTKEEILMIPYGTKLIKILEKIGIYEN